MGQTSRIMHSKLARKVVKGRQRAAAAPETLGYALSSTQAERSLLWAVMCKLHAWCMRCDQFARVGNRRLARAAFEQLADSFEVLMLFARRDPREARKCFEVDNPSFPDNMLCEIVARIHQHGAEAAAASLDAARAGLVAVSDLHRERSMIACGDGPELLTLAEAELDIKNFRICIFNLLYYAGIDYELELDNLCAANPAYRECLSAETAPGRAARDLAIADFKHGVYIWRYCDLHLMKVILFAYDPQYLHRLLFSCVDLIAREAAK